MCGLCYYNKKIYICIYYLYNKNMESFYKKSKYGNIKTEYDGYLYMSKREAQYAQQLNVLMKAKNIKNKVISFEKQVPFVIEVNGKKICKYLADFKVLYADGHEEIIDVKGMKTSIYKLKKKLVEALYNIKIIEI
jgi:hypothetical protein